MRTVRVKKGKTSIGVSYKTEALQKELEELYTTDFLESFTSFSERVANIDKVLETGKHTKAAANRRRSLEKRQEKVGQSSWDLYFANHILDLLSKAQTNQEKSPQFLSRLSGLFSHFSLRKNFLRRIYYDREHFADVVVDAEPLFQFSETDPSKKGVGVDNPEEYYYQLYKDKKESFIYPKAMLEPILYHLKTADGKYINHASGWAATVKDNILHIIIIEPNGKEWFAKKTGADYSMLGRDENEEQCELADFYVDLLNGLYRIFDVADWEWHFFNDVSTNMEAGWCLGMSTVNLLEWKRQWINQPDVDAKSTWSKTGQNFNSTVKLIAEALRDYYQLGIIEQHYLKGKELKSLSEQMPDVVPPVKPKISRPPSTRGRMTLENVTRRKK